LTGLKASVLSGAGSGAGSPWEETGPSARVTLIGLRKTFLHIAFPLLHADRAYAHTDKTVGHTDAPQLLRDEGFRAIEAYSRDDAIFSTDKVDRASIELPT
jgi:hypothetical protein